MAELSHKSIIESRRLLYFFYVAKHGSFSRAEGVLDAPQPVISRQIAKLEDELGVQLLDRNGRGVTLTPFGEILLRHAETILREMGNAISELDIAKRKPAGQVRLAAPATFMTLYMPEILRRFMEELPDVELVITQLLTGEIYERLVSDYIDIGIVHSVPNKTRFEVRELLVEVQHQLFNLGGELSIPGFELLKAEAVLALDAALAEHNAALPKLQEFILPAGSRAASLAHVCRTVARRAERAVVALGAEEALNDTPRQYLNRLSDLMFVLARVLNRMNGGDDVYWKSQRLAEAEKP